MLTSTREVWLAAREVRLALVLTGGFFVVVVVAALVVTLSGGDDTPTASDITPSERKPVKVVIAGTNDAHGAQTEGYIAGIGTFKATGAITDHGSVTGYRLVPNDELILLRFVSKGTKGTITFLVTIHHAQLPPDVTMEDRVCDEGVQRTPRRGHRVRGRRLHRQHAEGNGLALTRGEAADRGARARGGRAELARNEKARRSRPSCYDLAFRMISCLRAGSSSRPRSSRRSLRVAGPARRRCGSGAPPDARLDDSSSAWLKLVNVASHPRRDSRRSS